jgi:hypothetical protein
MWKQRIFAAICHPTTCQQAGLDQSEFTPFHSETTTESVDLAKGTIYKHFPVKESLLCYRFIQYRQSSGEFRDDIDTTTHYLEFSYLAALMRWLNGAAPNLMASSTPCLPSFCGGCSHDP